MTSDRAELLMLLKSALAYVPPTTATHEDIAEVLYRETGWLCPCGYTCRNLLSQIELVNPDAITSAWREWAQANGAKEWEKVEDIERELGRGDDDSEEWAAEREAREERDELEEAAADYSRSVRRP